MEPNVDILELKFTGSDINPAIVKPSEIGNLLTSFEKALLLTIKQNNPEIDTDAVLFSFEHIKHESLDLQFSTRKVNDIVLSNFYLISTSISNNNFDNLNNGTIQALKGIVKFTKKYNCTAYFNHNNNSLSSLNPNSSITVSKTFSAKGQTTIYGKIIDVGGEKPNVHIKIDEGDDALIIPTSEAFAKELGKRLFEVVGLHGKAEWNIITSEILSFNIESILDYQGGNVFNAFKGLKTLSNGFWDNYNTDEEINSQLLRD